nr:hypothetical protein [Cytophagales bacterium]
MNFKTKFEKSFRNFSNISFPDYNLDQVNSFADFIELILIFSKNELITEGDIQDRFFGTKNYESSDERDLDESFIKEIFYLLFERSILYGVEYPFHFDEKGWLLKKKDVLTVKNKAYIYLLFASKLNIFRPFLSEITKEFETISKGVLENYLPRQAIIKEFGDNSEYKGNAREKIKNLAYEIGLEIDEHEVSQINERNTKERGLDIVAWIPFHDNCINMEILLCQCACGKDYEKKQHDTRRFKNYIRFYKKPFSHLLFIPYGIINPKSRKFFKSDLVEDDFLIFERKRILSLHNFKGFSKFRSFRIVNKAIEFEEYLV